MNILEIIPISRSTRLETLSYFTSEKPPIGAIVDVPIRSKIIHGIVASVRPAAEMKADLKTAPFSLKKIEKVKARDFLSPALIAAAREEADYAGATLGATLKAMVHESIFAEADKIIVESIKYKVESEYNKSKEQKVKSKDEEKREIDKKNDQVSMINDAINDNKSDNVPQNQSTKPTGNSSACSPRAQTQELASNESQDSRFRGNDNTIESIAPQSQVNQQIPNMSAYSLRTNSNTVHVLQGDDDDRYGAYRSMIRQEFAQKKSLLFLAPTIEEAGYLKSVLEKGIEKYIFIIHQGMTAKKICETWNKAVEEKHPIVMIATGSFMIFARADLDSIIIERENMRGWKHTRRPYLDMRHAIETYVKKADLQLYIGDLALRIETSRRQDQGNIEAGALFKARSVSSARDSIIDMKQYKGGTSFRILSESVENLIKKTIEENANMVVIAARKGLAPSTVCGDCHAIVVCKNCGAPVVLHEYKKVNNLGRNLEEALAHSTSSAATQDERRLFRHERSDMRKSTSAVVGGADKDLEDETAEETSNVPTYFLCHHCGERRSTEEYCKNCGSWKLGTVGIGIDLVKKKIVDLFPGIKIFQLDSDSAPTPKKIKETIEKFKVTPGSILLGTELLVNYFHTPVPYVAVVTLDSLLALPDFRISEHIFYMLLRLRALTERELVIQTRKPEEKTFELAAKGNITDFVRHSLEERKLFCWPPYSTLIKLSIEGKRDTIAAEMEKIKIFLAPIEIDIFPSFTAGARGNSLLHGIIRLPAGSWPNIELLSKLRSLPPSVSVNVDPESLL